MITLGSDIVDRRVEFEERFRNIAMKRSIESNGLLRTDLLPVKHNQTFNQPITTDNTIDESAATLVVPGLLGNSLRATIAPFLCARERLTVKDYDIEVAWVSGRSGCQKNARTLRRHVLEAAERSGAAVNLICYSKGCADALSMIGQYTDTHVCVRALVSFAGVVSGTPLADSAPWYLSKILQYAPIPGEPFGDGKAIKDLTTKSRLRWMENHPIPSHIRLASVLAAPHATQVSRILRGTYRKLASTDQYNDSQVIASDALLPHSELLTIANADHWAIALPIEEKHKLLSRLLVNKNRFPRDVLLQSIIDHLQFTRRASVSSLNL